MNKSMFTGGLTADAKINDAGTVARFALGVARSFKNKDGKYDSDYPKFVLYGDKVIAAFKDRLVKGTQFEIEARFQNNNYEKDGQKVYDYEFVVERLRPIGGSNSKKEENQNPAESPAGNDGFVAADDAELPWN